MDENPAYGGAQPPPAPPAAPPPMPPLVPGEPLNPWFSIWVQPRATTRQILDSNPRRMVHLLPVLGGAIESLRSNIPEAVVGSVPILVLACVKLIFGALAGLLFLYIFSFLLRLTGRWLDGKADFVSVRAAIAWSYIPTIWSALLFLPLLVYLGAEAFNVDLTALMEEPGAMMLLIPLGFVTFVVGIWQLVVLIKCLAEAHRFSAWHSLGAFLLGILIFAVPIIVLAIAAGFLLVALGLVPA